MLELNKVYNGDCLSIMKDINDKSIDMILCDLPYGNGTTACKWDTMIPLDKLWELYNKIIKNNCPIVLFCSQPFTTILISSNIKNYKYSWIWNKQKGGNFAIAKYQPIRITEEISVFTNNGNKTNYNPQMEKAKEENKRPRNDITIKKTDFLHNGFKSGEFRCKEGRDENLRYPTNLINIKSTEKECNQLNRLHPTQKPVKLCEYLIKTYTNERDLVLDNTCGSGSTLVASQNIKRNFLGIEKDENYYKISLERLKKNEFFD